MKLGVLTVPLYGMPVKEALEYLAKLGVQAVEIGTGGFPGNAHCNAQELLSDAGKRRDYLDLFTQTGVELNALSCHGNPVHPNKEVAAKANSELMDTIHLAQELGVSKVITFSGCPGDSPDSHYPNWVTCPWPDDFLKVLDYQWNDCLLPYWQEAAKEAKKCGVRIAFEMHPGFCVYNTASMLRIRQEIGDTLGANFDPSHLIWQGNDMEESIRALQGAIYHVHAKDCAVNAATVARKGVLDTNHFGQVMDRSWMFRTVGYGHGQEFWKKTISALRLTGYDDVISIEHEDCLMSVREGLERAVDAVRDAIITEPAAEMWWA